MSRHEYTGSLWDVVEGLAGALFSLLAIVMLTVSYFTENAYAMGFWGVLLIVDAIREVTR